MRARSRTRAPWWSAVSGPWRRYVITATLPALQHVRQASSRRGRAVWTLLALLGAALTARDAWFATCAYLEHPVLTAMAADPDVALSFPAVTVCSLNRVHCSNLRRLARMHAALPLAQLSDMAECGDKRVRRQTVVEEKVSNTTTNKTLPVRQTRNFNHLMNFLAAYTTFPRDLRSDMGHSFSQLVRSCTFSGKSCLNQTEYFQKTVHTGYGNCFTFRTRRKTVIPGKDYGLSLELWLSRDQVLRAGLSPHVGARVVVHPPGHEPLPDENGFNVSPHAATTIALQQVEVMRKELPYVTNCSSSWSRTWYADVVGDSYLYSLERCRRICLQMAFEDRCNCVHPSYMDLERGIQPCNLTSRNHNSHCAADVLEEFESRARSCSCNVDCREITYETRISTAVWPTETNWCTVAKKYSLVNDCTDADEQYGGDQHRSEKKIVEDNALKIEVYFENLRVRSITQTPAYEVQTFVGSLGGALSLYLGITLLMLLELLELFFNICCSLLKYWINKAPKKHKINVKPYFAAGKHTNYLNQHQRTFVW